MSATESNTTTHELGMNTQRPPVLLPGESISFYDLEIPGSEPRIEYTFWLNTEQFIVIIAPSLAEARTRCLIWVRETILRNAAGMKALQSALNIGTGGDGYSDIHDNEWTDFIEGEYTRLAVEGLNTYYDTTMQEHMEDARLDRDWQDRG